jgi:hypothetical protein
MARRRGRTRKALIASSDLTSLPYYLGMEVTHTWPGNGIGLPCSPESYHSGDASSCFALA